MIQDNGWTTVLKKREKSNVGSTPLADHIVPNISPDLSSNKSEQTFEEEKEIISQRHHGAQVSGIVKRRDEWTDHCLIDMEDGLEDVFCHRHRCQNKKLPPAGATVYFKLHLSSKTQCWQSGLVTWDHSVEEKEDVEDIMKEKEQDLIEEETPENVVPLFSQVSRKNSDDGQSAVWPHCPPERTETPIVSKNTTLHNFCRSASSIDAECFLPETRPRAGSAPVNGGIWDTLDTNNDQSSVETWATSLMGILNSREKEKDRPQTPKITPPGLFHHSTPPPKSTETLSFSAGLGRISPLVQDTPDLPLFDGRVSPLFSKKGTSALPYSVNMSPLALLNAEQSREADLSSSLTIQTTPGRPPRPPSAPTIAIQPPRCASVFSNATPPPAAGVATPLHGSYETDFLAKSSPSLLHSENRVQLKVISVDEPRLPWLATARVPQTKAAPLAILNQSIDAAVEAGNASAILKLKRRRETRKRAKRGEHCRVELGIEETNNTKMLVVDAYAVNAAGAGAALRFMLRANAAAVLKANGNDSERAELEALGWAELVAQLKLVLAPFEPQGICCNHLSRAFEKKFGSALVETLFGEFESLAALLRAPELRHVVNLKESPGKPDLSVSLCSSKNTFKNKSGTPISSKVTRNGTPSSLGGRATPESLRRVSPNMIWHSDSNDNNFLPSSNRPHISPGLSPPGIGRRNQQVISAPKLPTDFFRPISTVCSGPSLSSSLSADRATGFPVVHPRLVDPAAVLGGAGISTNLSVPTFDMRSLSLGTAVPKSVSQF